MYKVKRIDNFLLSRKYLCLIDGQKYSHLTIYSNNLLHTFIHYIIRYIFRFCFEIIFVNPC